MQPIYKLYHANATDQDRCFAGLVMTNHFGDIFLVLECFSPCSYNTVLPITNELLAEWKYLKLVEAVE